MLATNAYATTNVTTSAYVTLTTTTASASFLSIVDTSTALMKLAYGPAGHEVDLCAFQGNGNPVFIPNVFIPIGTRLALKAISGTASTGFNTVIYN